jgi:hypothetical protein
MSRLYDFRAIGALVDVSVPLGRRAIVSMVSTPVLEHVELCVRYRGLGRNEPRGEKNRERKPAAFLYMFSDDG